MVVFLQSGCIRAKIVVFGQKLLYSGKIVVFGQNGSIRAKVILFEQSGCISRIQQLCESTTTFAPNTRTFAGIQRI